MGSRGRDRSRERREPSFDAPDRRSSSDFRLTEDDRPAPPVSKRQARADARRGSRDRDRGRTPRRSGSLIGRLVYWSAVMCLWGVIVVAGLVAYYATRLPPIDQLAIPKRPPNVAILASDGSLIANRGETGGRAMTLKELPPYLPKAFVAIEDRRFYEHFGIDPVGIARALVRNVTRSGGGVQGGSTLTQQLAKNLFLTQERTASRKIQEAILALWLERNYTKDQILELYLNRVYFGSGAYGVDAAAQRYFAKSARQVTLGEAAILAGLVQSPSRLAPNRNPAGAQARGELVLAAMARDGFASDAMIKLALMNPAQPVKPVGAGSFGYAADYVMDVLDDYIGTIDTDLSVTTTIDQTMQLAAEKALTEELAVKGDKFGVSQGAVVAMLPDGAIKALVGGRNYAESQFNRVVTAKRQPGSAFKPFVYLTAIEHGLTPDTVREDSPLNVRGWQPENYSRDYKGPVTLRTALAQSLNTVAVRVGLEMGPKNVVATASRLGIRSKLEPNASIALGTSEVSPLELVSAYAPFANGGLGVLPYVIDKVKTREGKVIYSRSGGGLGRVIDPSAVGMMNAMMRETLVTGTARKAEIAGWEAAGKTGTSQEFRDAWFVGYTSTLVAGVWLGNDDGSPTKRVSGGNLPVEVWSRFMKTGLQGMPPQPLPGMPSGWSLPSLFGTPSADASAPSAASSARPVAPAGSAQARNDDAPRPPGLVSGATQRQQQPRREANFLDKLFGG
jgi:penicillin-binding protein 1A